MDHHHVGATIFSELSDYIDIPMRISPNYQPRVFDIQLPDVVLPSFERYSYNFQLEKEILKMHAKDKEKINEKDKDKDKISENSSGDSSPTTSQTDTISGATPSKIPFPSPPPPLQPMPSHFNCDTNHKSDCSTTNQELKPRNRIDPADFESSSSSPFDDALLRAIDDKQELDRVFQHL
ncbi:uncharacterized protein LOC141854290 [Brevipalpus obovatus]|uniref:uncharacterized protein LOC141854290 n=1 Tax=Brevipalpus obovatus TaxID=246614 RepID=UPI003D9F4F28